MLESLQVVHALDNKSGKETGISSSQALGNQQHQRTPAIPSHQLLPEGKGSEKTPGKDRHRREGLKRSVPLHPSTSIWEDQVSTFASPNPGQASSITCISKATVPGFMKTHSSLLCLVAFQTNSAYHSQSISTSSSQHVFECWSCQTRTNFGQ